MSRRIILGLVFAGCLATPCFGQEWARKMFKTTECDFGSVARGGKAEYRFIFENLYLEDVHIASAYSSCGCTSVRVENPTVKTYEKGAIVAHFNTDTFSGQRGATLTVVIDQPYPAVVELHDRGYIRSDVTFEPGSVQIGSLDQGTPFDQSVTVNYSGGNGDWNVQEVKSSNPHISAQAVETARAYGQTSYEIKVHVAQNCARRIPHRPFDVGDQRRPNIRIPLPVEGQVVAGVSVSPAALFIGVVQPVKKSPSSLWSPANSRFASFRFPATTSLSSSPRRRATPFRSVSTKSPRPSWPAADTGKVVKSIKIKTDLGETMPELPAYAVVAAATATP